MDTLFILVAIYATAGIITGAIYFTWLSATRKKFNNSMISICVEATFSTLVWPILIIGLLSELGHQYE